VLDAVLEPLPARRGSRQSTAEEATATVQAPDVLLRDGQAQDAAARAGVPHPALCKLEIAQSEQRQASPNCTSKWLDKHSSSPIFIKKAKLKVLKYLNQ